MEAVKQQPGSSPDSDVRFLKGQEVSIRDYLVWSLSELKNLQVDRRALAILGLGMTGMAAMSKIV